MKPTLQMNLQQNLLLTPQLQQAIRLLQLSTQDLQLEIQQVVDANPLLDASPVEEPQDNTETEDYAECQWSHLYKLGQSPNGINEPDFNFDNLHSSTTNLQDHLRWQLELTPMSDIDKAIATVIIDAIHDDGFLTVSVEELHANLLQYHLSIDVEEVLAVKHRIQQFDPVGCASSSLAETLLVQLAQLPEENADVLLAKQIIEHHIAILGQHNYRQLKKIFDIDDDTLNRALHIIQSLHPKPGTIIPQQHTEYVIPDIIVKKIHGAWQVYLNPNTLPKLSINNHYAAMIQRGNPTADNLFLKNNLQEARWFLKSIQSRQDTLLKVARTIVNYQLDFFEYGEEKMKPLILSDIANALELHESTISRVTTQKFIYTPRGVYELKYFFSSHVPTNSGGECSSTAIRAIIKRMIAAEQGEKPLSDSQLAQLISEEGIQIARRTVAKYREAMGVPSSNERKSPKR